MRGDRGLAFCLTLALGAAAQAVTIDWVTVGDAPNAPDDTTHGRVTYEYRISRYETAAGQYTEFLTAVAATDAYGLYNNRHVVGHLRLQDPAHWLLWELQLFRCRGPGIPGYWTYPTMSDTAPSNDLIDPDPGNNATFYDSGYTIGSPYWCTEVGAHEASAGPYGTFDQGGNLWEWNEAATGSSRGLRGGSWGTSADILSASPRIGCDPSNDNNGVGFRLAGSLESTAIPEPATVSLFGIALAALLRRRRRRRSPLPFGSSPLR